MNITLLEAKQPPVNLSIPVFLSSVPAGFPSPADDYIESSLDLNEYLVKHPSATFYARGSGDSMINKGILDGALLIVDRSLAYHHEDVVIAVVNGELTCKVVDIHACVLRAANPAYKSIPISAEIDCLIQGVVVHAINKTCTHS